jgi:hypothetical protein
MSAKLAIWNSSHWEPIGKRADDDEEQRILHRRAQIRAMSAAICPHCGAPLFVPDEPPDAPADDAPPSGWRDRQPLL